MNLYDLFSLFMPRVQELENKKNIPGLLRVLQNEKSEDTRNNAARALVKLLFEKPDSRAIKPLIKALKDPSEYVRENAAYALRYVPSEEVVNALIESLNHPDYGTNISAIDSLSVIGHPKAIEPLIKKLNESINPPSLNPLLSGPVLMGTLKLISNLPKVRVSIGKALKKFDDTRAIEAFLMFIRKLRLEKSPEYKEILGPDFDERFPDLEMKNISAQVFLRILQSQHSDILIECLNFLYYKMRNDQEIVKRILILLHHPDKAVQIEAEKSLSHVDSKSGLEAMLQCKDNNRVISLANKGLKAIAEREKQQRQEDAKPEYVKLIEKKSYGTATDKVVLSKSQLKAAEDHAAEFEPNLLGRIVNIYYQAANDSDNQYFENYRNGLELLPIAERVITRLAEFPHLHDAFRRIRDAYYESWSKSDPYADRSGELALRHADEETYKLIDQLVK